MILSCGNKELNFTVQGSPEVHSPTCYGERLLEAAMKATKDQHWMVLHSDMPVELFVTAYQEPPKGMAKWKKDAAVHGLIPPLRQEYGWAELTKCTIDLLHRVVYESKDQVFKIHWEVQYGEPKVDVKIIAYYTNIGDIKAEISKRNKGLVKSK